MNKTALVIMAAGIGSRYKGGIKQLEQVGPAGEIIMDYSIYDAIQAGFQKIVFIIRKDLENDFKEVIGNRIAEKIEVAYVFQEIGALPAGFFVPDGRTKPWGTGQAVLCCKDIVKEPFAVINADDFYGREAFIKVHEFLSGDGTVDSRHFCMAGFVLKNTLSEHGAVTRGICKVDPSGMLEAVEETYGIEQHGSGAVGKDGTGNEISLDLNVPVSMNMWGFSPDFIEILEHGFTDFLNKLSNNPLKAEYLLPHVVGELVESKRTSVAVLPTNDKWFGVTYKEDKQSVVDSIRALIAEGDYPESIL